MVAFLLRSQVSQVLLLDEITVDLDVLGRADLMTYLVEETEQRKSTIIYVRPQLPRIWSILPGASSLSMHLKQY